MANKNKSLFFKKTDTIVKSTVKQEGKKKQAKEERKYRLLRPAPEMEHIHTH